MADVAIIAGSSWNYVNQDPKCLIVGRNDASKVYLVYIDNNQDLGYRKSTNGGSSFAARVNILTGTVTCTGIWADWWTPGNTGTKIHFAYIESVTGDVFYNYLDTASDTLGTPVTVFAGTLSGGNCSVTVAVSGNILVQFRGGNGQTEGFYRSTNGGTSFGSRANVMEGDFLDTARLFPAPLADTSDIWALYYDWSASQLSLKTYDDSADSWSENTIASSVAQSTDNDRAVGAIRPSDGHLLVAIQNAVDVATGDLLTYDIASGASITAKTDVITNIDDFGAPIIFVAPNDDVYVGYLGKADGSETWRSSSRMYYKKSTDGMTTWGAEQAYSQTNRAQQYQLYAPNGYRFIPGFMADDSFFAYTAYTNFANSLDLTPSSALVVTSPAASFTASAPAPTLPFGFTAVADARFSMPDDDFPGFEDGFDEGTHVVWSATMLANANFSGLASLAGSALIVQSPSGLVTFSMPPINVPVRLLAPPANTNFSAVVRAAIEPKSPAALTTFAALASVAWQAVGRGNTNFGAANPSLAEILQAVPAHTLFSSPASAAYTPTGRGNANFSALALVAWSVLSPAALTTYAGGAKAAWQPAVVAALATFSGGNVSLNLPIVNITSPGSVSFSALASVAEILKAVPASTNFSAATVVAWQPVAVASAQFSALASAQWAVTARATVTFDGGAPRLTWVLQAVPAHALFSAVADYLLGGSLIQTPAASVLFSGAPGVTVPVRVQAVPAHALFSSGVPRLEESLSAVGSASFQAVARASLTPAPSPASVLYTAPAPTVIWTAVATTAQAVFSGSASAQRSLTTPAGLVTLTGVPPALENSVTTTAADATFDAPLIVVVKPGVILDTISTGMILPLGPGQASLPQTGTTNRPLVGTTRRRQI